MSSATLFPSSSQLDLVSEAKRHVQFLHRLHVRNVTFRPVTNYKIRRYVEYWLPLVASVSDSELLIPPADIAWLWHCHRLAPAVYAAYCEEHFQGRILEANPPFSFQAVDGDDPCCSSESEISKKTTNLWNERYPNEPFWFKDDHDKSEGDTCSMDHLKLNGLDIAASAQCQANFLWQVSGPRFADDDFLQEGVERYRKFLKLQSSLPLVPTYQIDLIWHTHMLSSLKLYNADCVAIRGRPFHHDDSLNDRTKGSTLDVAFRATIQLWNQAYPGTPYVVAGGMYRGEPPSIYYDTTIWAPTLGADGGDKIVAAVLGGSSSSGKDVVQWGKFRWDLFRCKLDGAWP